MTELSAAAAEPFGVNALEMVGVGVFDPRRYRQQKVAVKGVLIRDTSNSRINVTSLKSVAANCD
jgi:hypothetical protein